MHFRKGREGGRTHGKGAEITNPPKTSCQGVKDAFVILEKSIIQKVRPNKMALKKVCM